MSLRLAVLVGWSAVALACTLKGTARVEVIAPEGVNPFDAAVVTRVRLSAGGKTVEGPCCPPNLRLGEIDEGSEIQVELRAYDATGRLRFAGRSRRVRIAARSSDVSVYVAPPDSINRLRATLSEPRAGATATLLDSGHVVMVGGMSDQPDPPSSVEVLDPVKYTTSRLGPQLSVTGHASARVGSARAAGISGEAIIVTGGRHPLSQVAQSVVTALTLSGLAVSLGELRDSREGHTAASVGNQVLVAGGRNGALHRQTWELLDPDATGTGFTRVVVSGDGRVGHAAVALPDGRALVAGGSGEGGDRADGRRLGAVGQPETLTLRAARPSLTGVSWSDGRVVLFGGVSAPSPAEVFDPGANIAAELALTGSGLPTLRGLQAVALFGPGVIFVAGAERGDTEGAKAATLVSVGGGACLERRICPSRSLPLGVPRTEVAVTPLADGNILIAGGRDASGAASGVLEVYTPPFSE